MAESKTYSQLRQFGRLFTPSAMELGVYSLVSLILLSIGALTAVRNGLGINGDEFSVGALIPKNISGLLDSLQAHTALPALTTAVFWAGVGGIAYIFLWFVSNMIIGTRNDVVVIENYLKPSHGSEVSKAWHEFAESVALRLAGVTAMLAFSVVTISLLFPIYAGMFRYAILRWQEVNFLLNGLIGVLGLMMVLHIYVVLLRLILLRVRVFS